jgi:UvrD/REP helicase N-terminal domain/UvrD-like helicase C-terminal domain
MFDTLSETQSEVVFEKEGKFVVRACPGSGKTYSVAARLADRMSNWPLNNQGIAVISFTNAAWQEIERQVTTHFKIEKPIPYPHFLGTIDSFVNRFIFLPFGHLVMGCRNRPVLVGEPHGPWSGKGFVDSLFPNLTYDINGDLYPINKRGMPRQWENNQYIIPTKQRLIKAGYATQDDANYFAMKVLETYPNTAKAIIQRFRSFMIDEAQDTSEIQMRIIDLLIDNGLENIMLVGDPDQAIFEWHGAKPQLFIEKFNAWEENSILLNENRRSSQNICDCTCRLSSLEGTSTAINDDVKECTSIPIVRNYGIDNTDELIEDFRNLCSDFNIDVTPENAAIIFRSNNLFNAITGIKEIGFNNEPWEIKCSYAKDFAKGKYLFCHGDFRRGFRLIEQAIIKALSSSHYCSNQELERVVELNGFVNFRKGVYELLSMLPDTDCTIGEWIDGANSIFKDDDLEIDLKIKKSKGYLSFDQLFGLDNKSITESDFRIGTIHSIKGETFEAVLVILKTKGIGAMYKTMLNNNIQISDEEELRIVYVGITRPRQLLLLAVPDEENKAAWEARLFDQ